MSEALKMLPGPPRSDIGQILLRTTKLTEDQLEAARQAQSESGGTLTGQLVAAEAVTPDEVMTALSEQLGLPIRAQIRAEDVDVTLVEQVPIGFAKDHGLLPLRRGEGGAIQVAVLDPLNTSPLDDLRLLFDGAELKLELANQANDQPWLPRARVAFPTTQPCGEGIVPR